MAQDQDSSFKWFILITYSISWVSFICGFLYGYLGKSGARDTFYIIGGIGPIVAALSLMLTYQNKEYNKNFWRRAYNPKIGPMWLVLATVLLPIVLNMLLVVFSLIGSGPTFMFGSFVSKNGIFLLLSIVGILGWFGYAFPLLYKKFNKSSWIFTGLIIGALWSVWNIPLIFIAGSYPQSLGVTSFGFWEFLLLFPIQSLIISWVYTKTKSSTFAVLIFFLADITRLFFALPLAFQIIRFVVWILIAVFIVLNDLVFPVIRIPESQ